jgi:hypothetical protein
MEFKILRLKLQLSFIYKVPKNKKKRREIEMPLQHCSIAPKSSNFINTKSNAIFTSAGIIIDTIAKVAVPLLIIVFPIMLRARNGTETITGDRNIVVAMPSPLAHKKQQLSTKKKS